MAHIYRVVRPHEPDPANPLVLKKGEMVPFERGVSSPSADATPGQVDHRRSEPCRGSTRGHDDAHTARAPVQPRQG